MYCISDHTIYICTLHHHYIIITSLLNTPALHHHYIISYDWKLEQLTMSELRGAATNSTPFPDSIPIRNERTEDWELETVNTLYVCTRIIRIDQSLNMCYDEMCSMFLYMIIYTLSHTHTSSPFLFKHTRTYVIYSIFLPHNILYQGHSQRSGWSGL